MKVSLQVQQLEVPIQNEGTCPSPLPPSPSPPPPSSPASPSPREKHNTQEQAEEVGSKVVIHMWSTTRGLGLNSKLDS